MRHYKTVMRDRYKHETIADALNEAAADGYTLDEIIGTGVALMSKSVKSMPKAPAPSSDDE